MTNTDLPELDVDALARIEEVRKSCEDRVREAREEGTRLVRLGADCAIGSDSQLPSDAKKQADFVLAQALADALLLYFNVSTYEYFVVTPGISEFTTLLVKLDAMAMAEFPGAPFGLEAQKRSWMSRASGRATLQRAAGQVNMTFWHDLQAQFQAVGCPHAYAVPGNGWWHIDGLPNDPSELDTLKSRLFFAIRQAVAGLGFTDTSVGVAVWLDLLRNGSPHYSNRCINNLCAASAEFCAELGACSTGKGHAGAIGEKPRLNVALIEKWIADEGYTNKELAGQLGTSERVVSSIRNEGKYHGRDALTTLANLMNRDVDDLYES